MRRSLTLFATVMVLVGLMAAPAAAGPQGYIEDQIEYGYFYGTWDQSPNVMLFAGGEAEEFCEGDPGTAPLRVFLREDGSVDLKVDDKNQPIYLYYNYNENPDTPLWLEDVCNGTLNPELFAVGTADLKVRVSVISESLVDVFNSVNGKATGIDGREYKVSASADLIVEDGVPLGNPEDFVDLKLTEIRR